MAFKPVGGARVYYKYSETKPGTWLLKNAKYIGTEQNSTYGNLQHLFDVDGTTHVLNGSGQLDHIVEKYLNPGQRCNVRFDGKVLLTKGKFAGKDACQFHVEVETADEPQAEAAQPTPSNVQTQQPVNAKPKPTTMKAAAKAKTVKEPYVPAGDDIEL